MPVPQQLPCVPWTTEERVDCMCPTPANVGGPCVDPPVPGVPTWTTEEIIGIVSKILFEKTCRRFPGVCDAPQLRPCDPCRSCGDCCECRYEFVPLAGLYPVVDITEVKIDGAIIPPTSYRVDEYNRLVRTDGLLWPRWQNMNADPDIVGERTFVIRYRVGRPVPPDLEYAAALLACELKKFCNGNGCRLPDRVTSVVRDGVTYEVLDAQEVANTYGSFGIPHLDAIVKPYRCEKPRANLNTRLFHPLLDGERYDRSGVRG